VAAAPATLDTLNELAAALGNDPSFATTISTALGNRLRVDINTQGLSATLQGYGRTNLGLGTAATSNTGDFVAYRTFGTAANSATGDFVAYRTFGTAANNNTGDFALASHTHSIANVTGLQTALDGKQASGSYAAATHSHIISDVTGLQTALDGKQASLGFTPYNSTNPSGYITSSGSISGNAATATNVAYSGLTGTVPTWNQNTTGTAAYATQWGTSAGYANFSSTAISASVGWLFGTTGNGTYAPVSLASVATLLGLGSLAYSSATIPTNNNQLTNGAGYITSTGNISGYAMSLNGYTGQTEYVILTGPANGPVIKVRYDGATANRYIDIGSKDGNGVYSEGLKLYNGSTMTWLGYTVYHSGNVPTWNQNTTGTAASISGYNNPTTASTANTIVYRDASGDVAAREFVLTAATVHTVTPSSIVGIYPTTNQVVKFSASAIQTFLGLGSLAYSSATIPTNNNQLTNGAGYITGVTNISGNAGTVTNGVYTNVVNTIVSGDSATLIVYGASSYSAAAALYLGGWSTDTTYARIRTSNGNLHIDTRGGAGNVYQMYFNHYSSGDMYFGNGGGTVYMYGGRLKHSNGTDYVYNSGTWGINITGSAATATDSTKLPLAGGTMTGTINITNTDIRSNSTSNWTGAPGAQGKIQYHASRWYIVADQASDRIVQFRRNDTDTSYISNDGTFIGSISGNAATATLATTANSLAANTSPTIQVLNFTGVGGNSGNANQGYAIYQEGGAWAPPFPDLCIGYHTGIKIGAYFGYNGTRFYNNSDFATQTFSVNDGDNHVRVAYNLYVGGTISGSNLSGTNTGDQTNISGNAATTSQRTFDYLKVTDTSGYISLLTGFDNSSRIYADGNRKAIVINADYYPALYLNAYSGSNTNHGAYIVMSGTLSAGGHRQWTMGIAGYDPAVFSIGYNDNMAGNGHYGTGDGWSGTDAHHGRLIVDTAGNTKIRGMLYVNGTSGGMTVGSAVIHAGNIGSQTVGNTNSISNALGNTHTWTGAQNNFLGNGNTASTNNVGLVVYSTGGNGAQMSFHRSGAYAVNMGLDSDNVFRIGGWSAAANRLQLDMSGNLTVVNVNATNYYMSGNTAKYITNFAGSHTAIYIGGSQNAYSGFTVDGGMRVMVHTSGVGAPCGFYHEGQGWSALFYVNGTSALFYAAAEKIITQSYGVYVTGEIRASSDITAYYSDIRLKKDIDVIPNAIEKIKKLRGVTYTWNEEEVNVVKNRSGQRDIGLIAQEVEAIEPLFTKEYQTPLEETPKDANAAANFTPRMSETYKTIKYDKLVALLVEGMKEQQLQIEELKNKLDNVLSSR
jgi:hypothetical protein